MATLAVTNDFSAGAAIVASEMNTNFSDVETFINSTPGVLQLTGGTVTGAVTLSNTLTVGADDTGYDVKFFGATSGAYMLWDEDQDDLVLAGAAGLDIEGDIDVDGITNLDVVDIDGAVDIANTLTITGDYDFTIATSNTQILGPASGSATSGAVSYSFSGDPDTGWYRPDTNKMEWATNGVGRMSIDAGGSIAMVDTDVIDYTNWLPNLQVRAPVHIKNWTGTAASPTEGVDWPSALLNLSTFSNYSWNSMIQFGLSNDVPYNTNLDLYWHISLFQSGSTDQTTSDSSTDLAIMGPGEFSIRTASADRLRIDTTGLLTSPRSYAATTGNAANLWVDTDGSFYRSTAGSIRLKTDVEDAGDSYADEVLNLRPVWFRSLATADRRDWSHWGLVAEEVAEIDPRLVEWGWTPVEDADGNQIEIVTEAVEAVAATYDEDGNELTPKVQPTVREVELVWELDADGEKVLRPDGVQYTKIIPLLINLVKRQDARIAVLEAA